MTMSLKAWRQSLRNWDRWALVKVFMSATGQLREAVLVDIAVVGLAIDVGQEALGVSPISA